MSTGLILMVVSMRMLPRVLKIQIMIFVNQKDVRPAVEITLIVWIAALYLMIERRYKEVGKT